jgi:hypothetical protein
VETTGLTGALLNVRIYRALRALQKLRALERARPSPNPSAPPA